MVSILGPDGQPIRTEAIAEPQTARIAQLQREFQGHPSRGLTPSRLAQILEAAEQGDLIAQYELFEDMEEKDGHIAAEMGKRRRAVSGLDWDIAPPPNATAKEKDIAKRVKETIDEIADFDELLFDVTDAIGKAFVCMEIEWDKSDGVRVPKSVTHRPQSWFQLYRGYRQEVRLRDGSPDGAPLWPFGWITHTHKCKSGYLERSGLFRVLVWPYLFKNYSIADLAEWLEIYGIPLRLGSYPASAGDKEKAALLRALVHVGHNAAGIMPQGMEVDFHDAATGDAKAFELMMDWCERTESKVILGATLTSQADRGSNTNALGNVHEGVRKDLRDSDARQASATLTRDLVYPIAALSGWVDSFRRTPRFVLNTSEPEDIKTYADSLPPLVKLGLRIGRQWAQEKLGIPEPEGDEDVLSESAPAAVPVPVLESDNPAPPTANAKRRDAVAARAQPDDYVDAVVEQLAMRAGQVTDGWLATIRAIVSSSTSYDEMLGRLAELLTTLPLDELGETIEGAIAASGSAGRYDAAIEGGNRA